MSELGTISVRLGADDAALRAGLASAQASVKAFGQQIGDAGRSIRDNVGVPLAAFGTAAVLAAGESDRLTKALVAVTGSAGEAGTQMERLREIARAPGLGFAEAIQASVSLQAVGVDAATAERAIKEFGNALATTGGTKEDFAEVIRQFVQIQSLGKVTAENLNVIRERAPAVAGALQEAFAGVDLTTVPVEEFNRVVLGKLEELGRAAPSLLEPFVNAFDDVKAALVPLGVSIAEALTPVIQAVVPVLQSLSDAFAGLSPEMRQTLAVVGLVAVALGPLLIAVGAIAAAVSAALPVLSAVAVAFATVTAPVVIAVGVFGALAVIVYKNRDALYEFALRAQAAMTQARAAILGFVAGALEGLATFYNTLGQAVPFFATVGQALTTAAGQVRVFEQSARVDLSQMRGELNQTARAAEGFTRALSEGEKAFFGRIRANSGRSGGGGNIPPALPAYVPPALPNLGRVTAPVDVEAAAVRTRRTMSDVLDALGQANVLTAALNELGELTGFQTAERRVQAFRTALEDALGVTGGNVTQAVRDLDANLARARASLDAFADAARAIPAQVAPRAAAALPDATVRTTGAALLPTTLARITPLLREAAEQTARLADNLAGAFSEAVVEGAFSLVGALASGRNVFAELGDAARDFGAAFVDSLKGVLVELGRVLLRGLAVRAVLGAIGLVSGGAGTAVAGLLGAAVGAGKTGPTPVIPAGRSAAQALSLGLGDARLSATGDIIIPARVTLAQVRTAQRDEAAFGVSTGAL